MINVYEKLIAWLNEATGEGVTVIARNPGSANQPPSPFVTVKVQSNRDIAHSNRGVDDDGDNQLTRYKLLTVSIQIQAQADGDILQAETIAQDIVRSLYNQNLMVDKLGRSLAYGAMLLEPTDISYNAGTQWIPRVQMDLSFNAVEDFAIDSGTIETVAYSGDVEQQTIEGEVNHEH